MTGAVAEPVFTTGEVTETLVTEPTAAVCQDKLPEVSEAKTWPVKVGKAVGNFKT